MFVIVQCLDNLEKAGDEAIPDVVALTMKQAGVAITITSVTDVIVFAIGAVSVSNSTCMHVHKLVVTYNACIDR